MNLDDNDAPNINEILQDEETQGFSFGPERGREWADPGLVRESRPTRGSPRPRLALSLNSGTQSLVSKGDYPFAYNQR